MKKLLLVAISFLLLGVQNSHARNSAAAYDNKFYSQQEFVQVYNNTTTSLYRDYIVGVDAVDANDPATTAPTINPNVNLGQYVVEATGTTTDNIYVFGVIDDAVIPAGQLGRVCIRGPHKIVVKNQGALGTVPAFTVSQGLVLSQCSSNVDQPTSAGYPVNGGVACPYTTSTGTAGGMIGYVLSATATTDTGDAGQVVNGITTTGSEYWTWVSPQVLR